MPGLSRHDAAAQDSTQRIVEVSRVWSRQAQLSPLSVYGQHMVIRAPWQPAELQTTVPVGAPSVAVWAFPVPEIARIDSVRAALRARRIAVAIEQTPSVGLHGPRVRAIRTWAEEIGHC